MTPAKRRERHQGYRESGFWDINYDEKTSKYLWGSDQSYYVGERIETSEDMREYYRARNNATKATNGFTPMDEDRETLFDARDKFLHSLIRDPGTPNRVERFESLSTRLNRSYLVSEARAKRYIDRFTMFNLPDPRALQEEPTRWMYGEEYLPVINKPRGGYGIQFFQNLRKILSPLLEGKYGEGVKADAEALVTELSSIENPIKPLENDEAGRGGGWNRFIQLIDHRQRTYRKAPIMFSEMYLFQRLNEILRRHNLAEDVDVFAEGKRLLLKGALENVADTIETVYGREKGAGEVGNVDLHTLLKLSAEAGRVDLMHKHLYGDKLVISEYTRLERIDLDIREKWLREREEKMAEIERLKNERKEKELEQVKMGISVFGKENGNEEFEERIKTLEAEVEDYLKKTPKALERPQDMSLTKSDVDSYFSYEGREEKRIYIGDSPPDRQYGVLDSWTDGHDYTTVLRNDAKLVVEAIATVPPPGESEAEDEEEEERKSLLLVAGNAGLEMMTDLLLLDAFFLQSSSRRAKVHLAPVNTHPSLATEADFHEALEALASMEESETARDIAERLKKLLDSGRLELETHWFYSTPVPYWSAPKSLQEEMNTYSLIVVKGDRNYRRMTADLLHPPIAPFSRLTRGLFPDATLVAVRPINFPGSCIGLPIQGVTRALRRYDHKWDIAGLLTLVQMRSKTMGWSPLTKSSMADPT